ncbi:hypothetical protein SARC_16946, partial [Sphaeroforma arctica JP610]
NGTMTSTFNGMRSALAQIDLGVWIEEYVLYAGAYDQTSNDKCCLDIPAGDYCTWLR